MQFQFCIQLLYKTTLPGIQIVIAEFCNHLLFLAVLIIFLLAKVGDCKGNDYVYYIINHVKNSKPASFLTQKSVLNFYSLKKKHETGECFQ